MSNLTTRIALRDQFLTHLRELSQHRDERPDIVDTSYGPEPAFVLWEAEQMLDLVNRIRAEAERPPATLEEVLRIERGASGHSDYRHKYALRCAFLVLGENRP
ncbi:hypothetical protein [Streptosporangium vulgare]|uniref:Uncharacterized protein n=1 Tax=Streptosporangium vulgare TaxID=46190 RepID=A0ABV5TQ44_9ACTN